MEYSPQELEKFRTVAVRGLGLVAVGTGVYYAYRNEKVRAHVWHLRNGVGSFCISLFHDTQDRISQFSGQAPVLEDGTIPEVAPDPYGNFDPSDLEELENLLDSGKGNP
jgi:hypothetical protein